MYVKEEDISYSCLGILYGRNNKFMKNIHAFSLKHLGPELMLDNTT